MDSISFKDTPSGRYYARQKLIGEGKSIPPELEIYRADPEKQRQDRRDASARYRDKNREIVNQKTRDRRARLQQQIQHLKSQPCSDCEANFPSVCLDFDHRDCEEKVAPVAQMISNNWPIEKIMAEIDKCDLVCANCHRIRTATRAGWNESTLHRPNREA